MVEASEAVTGESFGTTVARGFVQLVLLKTAIANSKVLKAMWTRMEILPMKLTPLPRQRERGHSLCVTFLAKHRDTILSPAM